MKQKILSEFDTNRHTFQRFENKLKSIINELLQENKIQFHQITGRVKARESLERKIELKDKYNSVHEITDLIGIRIITYLESDVDKVAKIIEKEFEVDNDNSIDKRKLKSDQFGYRSLHYIVSLDEDRSKISEYKPFCLIKAEVQIRSTLQHAWAQIEHDLGYKGKASIPEEHVRSFNRLAALLETADKEFDRLKQDLSNYEKNVGLYISTAPEDVELNQASIASFTQSNAVIKKSLAITKRNTNAEIIEDLLDFRGILERFIGFFNIKTIKELQDEIIINEKTFLHFVNLFTSDITTDSLSSSIALFYFQHYLAAKSNDPVLIHKYLEFSPYPISNKENTVGQFIEVYNIAKKAMDGGGEI